MTEITPRGTPAAAVVTNPSGSDKLQIINGDNQPELTTLANAQGRAQTLTAAATLTANQSGSTLYLDLAGGFAVTLPSPALGLNYDFWVKTAPTGAYTIVSGGSANIIVGHVISSEDAAGSGDFETSGGDTITLVANTAVKGDRVYLHSDGTSWYVSAETSVQDAVTITTAS